MFSERPLKYSPPLHLRFALPLPHKPHSKTQGKFHCLKAIPPPHIPLDVSCLKYMLYQRSDNPFQERYKPFGGLI